MYLNGVWLHIEFKVVISLLFDFGFWRLLYLLWLFGIVCGLALFCYVIVVLFEWLFVFVSGVVTGCILADDIVWVVSFGFDIIMFVTLVV